jgi:hypothetical protein
MSRIKYKLISRSSYNQNQTYNIACSLNVYPESDYMTVLNKVERQAGACVQTFLLLAVLGLEFKASHKVARYSIT